MAEIGSELDFTGEARLDIGIGENGASAVIRKMNQIAAACQRLSPEVAMSLRGEALRLGESLEGVVKTAAKIALQEVVRNTPVDTGLARANWTVKCNRQTPQSHPTPETDKDGIRTIMEGTMEIDAADRQPGELYWISNSAAHITALEHGHSGQAPNGMTKLAIQSTNDYLNRQRIFKRGKL